VPQPWRDLVSDVLRSQQKFHETAQGAPPGPLKVRLLALSGRVDDGVRECWMIAQRGKSLGEAVARLDPAEIRRRLAIVEAHAVPSDARAGETADAVRAQLASARRIEQVAEDARSRLQLLAARLGEAVAQAVELTVRDDADVDVTALSTSVDAVVGELEALHRAVEETNEPGHTGQTHDPSA
jgi:hypothetical protein